MSRFVGSVLLLAGAACWITFHERPAAPTSRLPLANSKLPLHFVINQGQFHPRVAYAVQGRSSAAYFTATGVTYSLWNPSPIRPAKSTAASTVRLEFLDPSGGIHLEPLYAQDTVVSYFRGRPDQWATAVPSYGGLVYRQLWPGIDLEFSGAGGYLKYAFHLQPNADARRIRLTYRGAASVSLTSDGGLRVETGQGSLADDKPIAWQETPAGRLPVRASFQLAGDEVRFELGHYDRSLPLTIDPVVLIYAGYLGGSGSEWGWGIAVDSAGNAYVTGNTMSNQATFPVAVGPDLTFNSTQTYWADAFVAKINQSGTSLVYLSYLGGANDDSGYGIAVDAAGNAYVTGYTSSDQLTFPILAGPDLAYNGTGDAFVAKINPSGTALVYAGYLGGAQNDYGWSIAVDSSGNAFLTGFTLSSHATFPVLVGPDLTFNGGTDAFVAKLNPTGTALVYSGYIGGAGDDLGAGIALDTGGNAYVTGYALSTQTTFPVIAGPDLTHNGGQDAFVAKVNAAGSALLYAGFVGGAGFDSGVGIAVLPSGDALIAGSTGSDQSTFPAHGGPDLTFNGKTDAFVAKVNLTGVLVWAGYLGGTENDGGRAIAVDAAGNAYVSGFTASTEANFPVAVGPDLSYNGGEYDAFIAKISAHGNPVVYAGYLGGSSGDMADGIAVDANGAAYVSGRTLSTPATFPATVGPFLTFAGSTDAIVAKISAFPGTAGPTLAFRDSANAIYTTTFPAPDVRNSGGNFRLSPVAAISASGRAFLAARDSATGVWINFLKPDNLYDGWVFAGGNSPEQPALAVFDETAWIAVRDPWNSYYVRSYTPGEGFHDWQWLQGILATPPRIAACPNGDIYVAGKDTWNGVWTRRYRSSSASWQPWKFVGGIIAGAPAIACGADNAAYIAARDLSHNMWMARVAQELTVDWYYGAGIFDGDLQIVRSGPLLYVVGLSSSAPWYRTWLAGFGWFDTWRSPGGILTTFTPTTYNGYLYLAGQDPTGNLYWWSTLTRTWRNYGNRNIAVGSALAACGRP